MNKVFELPGCSITFLSNNFECISTRSVQDVCTFLEKTECVILRNIQRIEVDLFSDDDDVSEFYDFNPFDSPECILVFPVENCITKFLCIRKFLTSSNDVSD